MISFSDSDHLDIRAVLGEDGLVAGRYSGFEYRPQQVEMALAVKRAFDEKYHLAAEAGTGTGKSFAYLLPVIDQVLAKKAKILVSTYTITLQQQLINKDIPFLADILPVPFTAVLAKGRNNYLCTRRMEYSLGKQKKLFDDIFSELVKIRQWSYTTHDGSLSDMDFVPSPDAWDAVMSEHGNCRGRKCQHFKDCWYWAARRQLKTADIIIANHALLFSDLALKETSPGILPEYSFVVLDEAHNIEHVAEDHFGINLSNYTFTYLFNKLYNPRKRRGLLSFMPGSDTALDMLNACRKAQKVFFAQIQAWYDHSKNDTNGKCHPGFVDDNITQPLKDLRLALNTLSKDCDDEDQKSEFTRYIDKCRSIELDVKNFLIQPKEQSIYWIEVTGKRRTKTAMRSAPLDVGPDVKRCLFDKYDSVITTSATLSTAGSEKESFEFFSSRIGLEDFQPLQVGSPYDYQSQVTLYIEKDLPVPTSRDYPEAAARAIEKYLRQSDGKAFVLFTSYVMLRKVAEFIEPFMIENEMDLLCQGSGIDRSTLLDHFKRDHRSVLFGTDSFWQGVDVPGESLSNVIIVRLPFAVPNHPLIEGRIEYIKSLGENPFFSYQLPTAIIKFKQGFGRLIRNKTDSGIVVVLDSRIIKRPYGRLFLDAIPECKIEIVSHDEIQEDW